MCVCGGGGGGVCVWGGGCVSACVRVRVWGWVGVCVCCRDKHIIYLFLSRQKTCFVATNTCLSRQTRVCRDKARQK